MLQRRGLYFYGPAEDLVSEVAKHHPGIAKEAQALADFIANKVEYANLFKETPKS